MGASSAGNRWKHVWRHDAWIRPFLGQYRKTLLASLALGLLTMVFAAGLMFVSGFLISDAAEQPALGLYSLLIPLGFVQLFGVGKPFLGYFERLTSHDWVLRITSNMRLKLYNVIEASGFFWTATHRSGDALGLLADDIGHVQNLYLRTVFPLVIAWLLGVFTVVLVGAFSPLFGLFMLVSLGVLVLVLPLVSVVVNGARQFRVKELTNELYANAYDQVAGLPDWIFAQRKDDYVALIQEADGQAAEEGRRIRAANRRIDLVGQVVFGVVSTALLLAAALYFGSMAQEAAGIGVAGRPSDWIAAVVLGFFPLLEAFAPLPAATVEANAHLDSLERLNQQSDAAKADSVPVEPQALPLQSHPEGAPTVVLEGVRFAYSGNDEVLRGVDLRISPGEKIALLGPSGSGKSTLVSLLRGDLRPTQGAVALEFPRGERLSPSQMGDGVCEYISLVQQNTYLFNQTLYQNLALGDTSITREDALAALRAVGLSNLVTRLPKGINTVVDQAGLQFSGGERHRIALARVLLRKAPVVLLDEPMVSLDPVTEADLLRTLFDVLVDRTIIMVTHHLAGVHHMDKVVFLEKGTVALCGSPAQLAQESPRYQQLLAFDSGALSR